MKRRIALVIAVLALMLTGTGAMSPAQASNACLMSGTLRPDTPVTATTVMNEAPFGGTLNVTCPNGQSGSMQLTGLMTGTCSVWAATATVVTAGLWASGSATATVTLLPTTGFSVSASATVVLTYTVMANGNAGFDCLGLSGNVTYWALTGGTIVISI